MSLRPAWATEWGQDHPGELSETLCDKKISKKGLGHSSMVQSLSGMLEALMRPSTIKKEHLRKFYALDVCKDQKTSQVLKVLWKLVTSCLLSDLFRSSCGQQTVRNLPEPLGTSPGAHACSDIPAVLRDDHSPKPGCTHTCFLKSYITIYIYLYTKEFGSISLDFYINGITLNT